MTTRNDFAYKITAEALRAQILALVAEYYAAAFGPREFIPGKTPVPVSGRVFDATDLQYLVEAGLDFWLTTGRFAAQFEREFAQVFGLRHAMLVNSGSSANLLALSCLTSPRLDRGLRPGDEVITVAAGFPTTVNPIYQNRLTPVFVDVTIPTYNVDVTQLEQALSAHTRAVILAHTLGNPFDLSAVKAFVEKHGLWLIEDCCDAVGATYQGRSVGTFGDLATTSFYPAHHITMGEGGCVLTDDPKLKKLVESFRDWGRDCWCPPGKDNTCKNRFGWQMGTLPLGYDHKYIYSHLGYNLKATDFQAAVGLSQLRKLPKFIEKRRENFNLLYNGFKKEGLDEYFILPQWLSKSDVSWFGFPLTLRDGMRFQRKELINFLEKKGIGTRLLFAGNVTRQPAFTENNVNYRVISNLANTDKICMNTFWIGLWPGISERQVRYVIDSFVSFSRAINARRTGNHHGS